MASLGLGNPWESGSLILSSIFLLALPRRLRVLLNSPKKASSTGWVSRQILFALALLIIQLAVIAQLWSHQHDVNILIIFDNYILAIAALGIVILAVLEHHRSAQPSSIIPAYLILSRLQDVCEILTGNCSSSCQLVNLRAYLGGIWLALDPQLRDWIWYQTTSKPSTSEEAAGFLSRVFFCWISPVLKEGYNATLSLAGLPEIHNKLSSESLRMKAVGEWDSRVEPVTKWTLPFTLVRCLKDAFLSPIIPRLFVILFRYIQPIFMGAAIRFLRGSSEDTDDGGWLILYAAGIYVGMAVSAAMYQHQINRLKIMVRGALIGLIHNQSLNISSTGSDSDAVTLMSSDVDSVESSGEIFHETWAQLLEVIVGTVLLAARIQWFALLPLIIIFGCSRMSAYVAKHLDGRQKAWNAATQERIATITASLGGIKSLKMMGMEDAIESRVSQLRDNELRMSERLRWILVAYNASANALGIFAPVLTLIVYAMSSPRGGLRANEVFTSIALLAMVTHPANMVMTLIPRAVAVMAVFGRIQAYLIRPPVRDAREGLESVSHAASMDNVSVQPASVPRPILQDVCLDVGKGEMVACAGAVGSGKTTLAMALLGEAHLTSGSIRTASKKIAYCAQAPWLPSVTIRGAISGGFDLDHVWYKTVLDACSLNPDLQALPAGDRTLIENNGINLSGGQRQRIALARAVYSRYDTLILDDPFSALDGAVAEHIVGKLLGPGGLFKASGTTVFLVSNSTRLFPLADKLLVLRGSKAYLQDPRSFQHDWTASATIEVTQPTDTQRKGPGQKHRLHEAADDVSRRTGDMAVYGYYLNAVGPANVLVMTGCTATYSFGLTFSQYILKWATESSSDKLHGYLALYATVSFMAWAATSGAMWSTQMKIAIRSGMVLHAQLLARVLRAPLAYFTETDIGATLNRFAQDITLIDKQLPPALANLNTQIFKLLMQIILILCVQPVMIMTVPICFLCVYILQRIYLRTSRQLRFLDLESRSQLYTNFLDTANGVTTIRAFGWQDKFTAANNQALDLSQKPFYLLLCLQCWLKVILDCLIAIVVVILMGLTVMYRSTTTGADIGLALNLIIVANTTLLRLVQNWTSLETSLGAIARLKSVQEYVPSEHRAWGTLEPDPQWPAGDVRMEDVSVSYSETSKLALKNISLHINPGQKLIMMGRTGSGKSTLMLSLLQLLPPKTGSIQIDHIDITRIPLPTLRQHGFIAVPQDGFNIPTATLRFNLDPYHTSTDESIVSALKRTHLWEKISTSCSSTPPDHKTPLLQSIDFLDRPMSSFLPLSAGQLQLFALCRTLLRVQASPSTKPIIILDEASSSLDPETEGIVAEILREDLKEHTVIMIAHRVEGLMDVMRPGVDAIAMMQDGQIQKVETV